MHSEFGALFDEPTLSRSDPRPKLAPHRNSGDQRARVAVDEGAAIAFDASGAAVGDDLLADQQRIASIRRVLVALDAAYFEDYGTRPDASSRAGFECLMRYSVLSQPLLGAESTGRLVATWSKGSECLSIRFLDRYHLQFAIATATDQGSSRRWGAAHALTFLEEHPDAKRLASN